MTTLFRFVVAVALTVYFTAASAAEPESVPAKGRTLLFVDDHDILYRSGTQRVLHPLRRHAANPLILGDEKPWDGPIGWNHSVKTASFVSPSLPS